MTRTTPKSKRPAPDSRTARAEQPPVVVLLSGGIDSACVVAAYRADNHPIHAFFVDYGQPARRSELAAASAIAKHYDVPFRAVKLGARLPAANGEFFGRNALLVLLAAATVADQPLIVGMGIHAASPYYDTTISFATDIQRVLDGYAGGAVTLGAPFLTMTKASIVKFARRHRIPLAMTYSCESRSAPACGKCPSCSDRRACRVD